jgi:hypothetical protein
MRRFWFLILGLATVIPGSLVGQSRGWNAQVGGSLSGIATAQSTIRGADGVAGAGWLSGQVMRGGRAGELTFGAMVSLEPLFQGKCGYPRLLAGAPVCEDSPFQDYSHAHPFIMQLGGSYQRDFGNARLGLSGGLAGDPALGPEVYLHRPSAALDPIAPMLMHEVNPAHAVHGVVTVSAQIARLMLQGSAFNGGDPDRDPYDLDLDRLESWSVRALWRLSPQAVLSVSHGDMQHSNAHSMHGGTARLRAQIVSLEGQHMAGSTMLAFTAAAARHRMDGDPSYAGLLEAQAQRGRHTLFARGEWARREEMEGIHVLETDEHFMVTHDFRVAELAGGYGVQLLQRAGLAFTAGSRASLTFVPEYLQPRYGHARGTMFTFFLNAAPAKASGHHH